MEKVRDLNLLAEKLGCSLTQLSIAWTLKHEPVQCVLISAKTTEQLTQSLQALQVRRRNRCNQLLDTSRLQLLPRLSIAVMLEIERIIDNKPIRPPMISTLQKRGLISHGELNIRISVNVSVVTILSYNPHVFVYLMFSLKSGPKSLNRRELTLL